ncbi:MAG: DivIVA domain-containing protein [Actinomycetota bacterium]|nr:DivIVA domain-containing protein [Actinomycetota bacterium]
MKLWTELEGVEFALAVRGYDREEVDAFIDAAVVAIREIEDRNSAMHAKVKALESEVAAREQRSSSVEHAFLDAVEKKQAMLADAEKRATEILSRAEGHAADTAGAAEVEALREQARIMLDQANTMLADAEREAALIRSKAADEGEHAVVAIRIEAERMLEAAEAEAASRVARAEQQHDRLAAALRLLQDAVAEMLEQGAEQHEAIKVVLSDEHAGTGADDRGAAIA